MVRTGMLLIVITLIVCCSLGAQEVTLKKSMWSGWKYSVNGVDYERVGVSAGSLKNLMANNEKAVSELNSYSSNQTAAAVTGYISGGLIGWWLGGEIANKKDNDPALAYAGLAIMVPGFFLEAAASRNIKAAAEEFNGSSASIGLNIGTIRTSSPNEKPIGVILSYRF